MSSVKITELPNILGNQINPAVDVLPIVRVGANETDKITVEELGSILGGGLEGASYSYVAGKGTPEENGEELLTKYADISNKITTTNTSFSVLGAMDFGGGTYDIYFNDIISNLFITGYLYDITINGTDYQGIITTFTSNTSAIFSTNAPSGLTVSSFFIKLPNKVTLIVGPGRYYINNPTGQFYVYQNFVDIVSLTGEADVFLSGITVGVSNVRLKGLNTSKALSLGGAQAAFNLSVSDANQIFDTCVGGDYSFGYGGNISGTFINCTGGSDSFAAAATMSPPLGVSMIGSSFSPVVASGTFINCTAGNFSFGVGLVDGQASGIFTNCVAGDYSFGVSTGALGGNNSGTFSNCKGGISTFSSKYGTISGSYNNCTSGNQSFGSVITSTALFVNCTGGDECFAGNMFNSFEGKAYNCIAGLNSLGNMDTPSVSNFITAFTGRVSYCTKINGGVFGGAAGSGPNTVIACQDINGLQTW